MVSRTFLTYTHVVNESIEEGREWEVDEIQLEVSVDGEPYRMSRITKSAAFKWLTSTYGTGANISVKLNTVLLQSAVRWNGEEFPTSDAPQYRRAIVDELSGSITVRRLERVGDAVYLDYTTDHRPSNVTARVNQFTALLYAYGRALENGAPTTNAMFVTEKYRYANGTVDTLGYFGIDPRRALELYNGEISFTEGAERMRRRYFPEDDDLST